MFPGSENYADQTIEQLESLLKSYWEMIDEGEERRNFHGIGGRDPDAPSQTSLDDVRNRIYAIQKVISAKREAAAQNEMQMEVDPGAAVETTHLRPTEQVAGGDELPGYPLPEKPPAPPASADPPSVYNTPDDLSAVASATAPAWPTWITDTDWFDVPDDTLRFMVGSKERVTELRAWAKSELDRASFAVSKETIEQGEHLEELIEQLDAISAQMAGEAGMQMTVTEDQTFTPAQEAPRVAEPDPIESDPGPAPPPPGPSEAESNIRWVPIGAGLLLAGALAGILIPVLTSGSSHHSTNSSNSSSSTNGSTASTPAAGAFTPPLQVIGQFGPAGTGGVQLSVRLVNTTNPTAVTYDFTGPGIEPSATLNVPVAGTTFSIPASVDTGCPSPLQTWTATIVAIGGKTLSQLPAAEASANRSPLSATLGPCTKG